MRVGCKKLPSEDFIVLPTKREERQMDLEARKRMKLSQMKRQARNVGSTYEEPEDEYEWRSWPVHGMHERPVYHPQVRFQLLIM